jgi:hypothetical protein
VEGTIARRLAIDLDLEAVVRLDNESVKGRGLDNASHGRVLEVLLLVLAGLGVLVSEDEVDLSMFRKRHVPTISTPYLVCSTALVGSEHDDVRRSIRELLSVKRFVVLKELHVRTTTLQAVCKYVSMRTMITSCACVTYPEA